ncbi:hypothetical protein ACFQ2B_36750 [Streptomyces stramineus]|uniref:Ricin B lectin domain-containing protein n=1 Tax=Streptomyces stramineus TaxID=173861 RepID=A0ABP3KDX1_9ACTN
MRRPARVTAALGAVAALGLAAPAATASDAPDDTLRIHSSAFGGCLTAEGSGYRDPRGADRPWLVALQPCGAAPAARQLWIYSSATHQFSSVAEPYRCIDKQGSLFVTALCDADTPEQRFRTAPTGRAGERKIVSQSGGRIWEQVSHRSGGARDAVGEGVREARDAGAAPADRRWKIGPA